MALQSGAEGTVGVSPGQSGAEGTARVSQALLPRTPRFRPRPLRALAAWGSSPSKLQQSKLPLLTPPTSPGGLLAGEGAGGAAGTSCVPHPRQEGRAPGRFPRTAPGLPGWSVRTGSHGLSPALSGYLAPTSARWGGREPARPGCVPRVAARCLGLLPLRCRWLCRLSVGTKRAGRHCRCRRPAGTPSWSVWKAPCSRLPGPQLCNLCPDFLLPSGSSNQPSTQLQDQPSHGAPHTHTHTHTHTPLCCAKPSTYLTITDGTQSKLGAASEAFRPALSLISHPSPQALLPSDAQWPSSVLPQGLCTFCAAVSCALNPFLPFFA